MKPTTKLRLLPEKIQLPDGAEASFDGEALSLVDREGRLLIRYADGQAEVFAAGDLTLCAAGRLRLEGAEVEIHGRERAAIKSRDVALEADRATAVIGHGTVIAQELETTARRLLQQVERFELRATRLCESVRDAFRDVEDLAQTRVGRLRTLVRGTHNLHAERNIIVSTEETKIDGKRVLLG